MSATPIACDLDSLDANQRRRRVELWEELRPLVQEQRELADGYAFRFQSDGPTLVRIAELIQLERLCCPFIRFDVEVAPRSGPVWVRMTGEAGVKAILAAER